MKRLFHLAVRLYPSWWRQRYANEFEALLDDLKPGWGGLLDVIQGAVSMQIKTLGTIPVVCALSGAIAGGIMAMRTPEVCASSATIRLKGRDVANAPSATAEEVRVSLEKALDASNGARAATSVVLLGRDSAQTILKLTYQGSRSGARAACRGTTGRRDGQPEE